MNKAKWFVLIAVCLVMAAIRMTQVRTDINDFFFAGEGADSAFLVGQLQSGELSRRYLISLTHPGVDEQILFDFITTLQQRLESDPAVSRVWSRQTADETMQTLIELYLPHQVQLFSLSPEKDFTQLFTLDGLDAQATMIKQMLLGPDPMLAKSVIAQDPMLLTLNWLTKLEQRMNLQQDKADYSSLFVETQASGMDTEAQQAFQQSLLSLFQEVNQQYGNGISMEFTGVPVFALEIKKAVSADIQLLSILSSIAIVLLFVLVFRSLRALFVTALLMVTTVSVAVLTTGWVFGFVHGLTLALGSTLIGVCIDYPIHAMVHAAKQNGEQRSVLVRKIWPAMIIGGITTVIGYIALGMSGFPGLQQIAVFSAAGITAALLMTRFILPDLMNLLGIDMRPRLHLSWLLDLPNRQWLRLLVAAITILSLMIGISQIRWSTDLNTLSPALEGLKQQDQAIRSRLVSMEPGRFVLAEGDTLEQALQINETLQGRLELLQQQGDIEAYFPVFPWLASHELQQRNATAWNDSLLENGQQAFSRALARQGLVAKAFPRLTSSSESPLDTSKLRDTPAWPLISNQLIEEKDMAAVVIWLGRHDPGKVQAALEGLPQVRYFSQKDAVAELATQYRERALSMLLLGMLAMLLLLLWRYRSLLQAVRVLSPAAVSLVIVIAGWSLANEPLGMLHLIGLLLAAAICVDYGVFFSENRAGDQQLTFQAISVSAFTSALSFSCLAAATTPALHALALTVAPGVILGFLLCPLILGSKIADRIAPQESI